ncbi:MAG: DUF2283 domain-containing protein [Candidatus Woesearchaeota archaeon]
MNFDYDTIHDTLFIYNPHVKSKESVDLGNIIIDISDKKTVCSIEFLHASSIFKELGLTKNTLRTISHVTISTKNKCIFLSLTTDKKTYNTPILIPQAFT